MYIIVNNFLKTIFDDLDCIHPCENCTSLTSCESCVVSNTSERISDDNTCDCPVGFYNDGITA